MKIKKGNCRVEFFERINAGEIYMEYLHATRPMVKTVISLCISRGILMAGRKLVSLKGFYGNPPGNNTINADG